jgi:7-cyano-7-deazaguanine synthase
MMKAIVLLSGGIDSAVTLALALENGRECYAISFNYGQRHAVELKSAAAIAAHYGVKHKIIHIDPQTFANSSLVSELEMPTHRSIEEIRNGGIVNTYVPARNTLFLSYALGQAEIWGAQEIYFGPNADDRNGFPDCRPAYVEAFQKMIDVATQQSVEGAAPKLITPLIDLDKRQIVAAARRLGVPLDLTFSCYSPLPTGIACNACDACIIRLESSAP